MENLLVSGLIESVLSLASIVIGKLTITCEIKAELNRIKSTLSAIQAVLQDAEQKQWTSDVVKDWLGKLKEVAYDANDLIDEFASEDAIWKVRSKRSPMRKASKLFLLPEHHKFLQNIDGKIKALNGQLDSLEKEKSRYQLNTNRGEQAAMSRIPSTSAKVSSTIYGQHDQREKVKKALLKNLKSKDEVLPYAIYGMGGLGKTTLAKTIFHDHELVREFELRIWVCVSENFDIPRLIRAMLESIDGNASKYLQEVEGLQRELKKMLSHKKFLLILDDVWNEDKRKWDEFRDILTDCGAKGSAIIVTTRTEKIAVMMTNVRKTSCLCLSRLSEEDSWSLFKQQAIGERRTSYMERIGKELVEKCRGVPLAINALGGVMSTKLGEDEWKSVNESRIWKDESELFSTLGVSFYHLSPQLRPCFLYCCIFPKDHVLDKDDLILLWMANGFFPTMHWSVTGERIFKELVSRSFIQDVEETDDNFKKVTTCKIHDLMHDLGSSIMGDDCFNAEGRTGTTISSKVRHLFYETSSPSTELIPTESVKSFFGKDSSRWEPNVDPTFVIRMKHLRVLSLGFEEKRPLEGISRLAHLRVSSVGFEEKKLLEGISRLAQLRYLNLSGSDIKVLPDSMIYLQNLQSLNLENCRKLSKLPKDLNHLTSMCYLNISGCPGLKNMPDTKYLASQKMTINGLVVELDNRHSRISDLKQIEVCGELKLRQLQSVENPQDAGGDDLKSKSNLRKLELWWDNGKCARKDVGVYDRVIKALQPPPNLKQLWIYNYPGSQFPSWVDSLHLQELTTIRLDGCRRCENLPPLEKLPLRSLFLGSMPSVKFLVRGTYEENVSLFPSLIRLELYKMTGLEAWMATGGNEETSNSRNGGGVEMFMVLEELEVEDCENLTPAASRSWKMTSLQTLRVTHYNQLLSLCLDVTQLDILNIERCLKDDTPLTHLTSVQHLRIEGCENLTTLPVSFLGTLGSLSTLTVARCPNLTTLPDGVHYASLAELNIFECPKLYKKKCEEGGEFWPLVRYIPKINFG